MINEFHSEEMSFEYSPLYTEEGNSSHFSPLQRQFLGLSFLPMMSTGYFHHFLRETLRQNQQFLKYSPCYPQKLTSFQPYVERERFLTLSNFLEDVNLQVLQGL